ncbi:hypothetical protein BC830DRAFT_1128023 [Chytriomyces sp. MP71]|nr:hypothetical protein BC830DRAFT_1128023 [Chytriomyces sp. MP71]
MRRSKEKGQGERTVSRDSQMACFRPSIAQSRRAGNFAANQIMTDTQSKRLTHNETERARREQLNSAFTRLSYRVPSLKAQLSMAASAPSKACILEQASVYIQYLESLVADQRSQLAESDRKCFDLVAELHRISHLSGLQPDLSAINASLSKSSTCADGISRQNSPCHTQEVRLPSITKSMSIVPVTPIHSLSPLSTTSSPDFDCIPPTTRTATPSPSIGSDVEVEVASVASDAQLPPSPNKRPFEDPSQSSLLPEPKRGSIVLNRNTVIVAPQIPSRKESSRPIMKAGRRKGSTNFKASAPAQAVHCAPQLLFKLPSPSK